MHDCWRWWRARGAMRSLELYPVPVRRGARGLGTRAGRQPVPFESRPWRRRKEKGMDDGELRRPCPSSPGPLSSWQRILCSVTQSALVRFRRATVELPSRRPVSLTHGGTSVPDASHGIIELFLMDQNGGAHTSVATPVHLRVAAAATGSPSHAAVMTGTNHCVQPYTARQFTTR
jgi:hypothetical protein